MFSKIEFIAQPAGAPSHIKQLKARHVCTLDVEILYYKNATALRYFRSKFNAESLTKISRTSAYVHARAFKSPTEVIQKESKFFKIKMELQSIGKKITKQVSS